ncbi:DUF3667 domain-containing protein [Erythrobacter sp. SCSIO 43205]|uniref:DUF3667 domain-containing protein n=1 Tax=Erythrobacter sp. SCSIO 43205 TaxID=2779361 RepID=UPI001CA94E66|nr:DUF3667 domain-containing protein [Erythrobacter sp. SCSIO 43205]UAB78221.1 DUF3667 domain-containing protein [Erythrobacter sp. SCSIO 43205]
MSDIAEGIGTVVEGGVAGRAVEPERSSDGAHKPHGPDTCLNCGAHAPDTFCPNCGQKTHVHRSLAAIGHDLMHGVLHLDGKLWRTLPLLTFKPGKLTRRYIDGERAKFVSPMAMFLFSIFAMFAVFQMVGLTTPTDVNVPDPAQIVREQGEAEATRLRERIAELPENSQERERLTEELTTIEGYLEREAAGELTTQEIVEDIQAEAAQDGSAASADLLDNLNEALFTDNANVDVNLTGNETIDKGLLKKWRENPGLMLYKLQANGYKFSWLLIPISLPFVWLIFAWKRRFKAYDHAIFVTYSLSFMSLLFIAASVIGTLGVGAEIVALALLIIPPIHIYKQLRGAYDLSRFSAFWRLMVLSIFIWIIMILFLQALLLLGGF